MQTETPKPGDRSTTPIRVLVVDDQSFMRIALRQILEADGDIYVIGEARDGIEAVKMARELKPDAVTLDVEMPNMDGLQACTEILRDASPRPVIIMVSAHTQAGADAAVKALRFGAVDFVSKSSGFATTDLAHIDSELRLKVRAWVKPRALPQDDFDESRATDERAGWRPNLIVIGASTGGLQALTLLLANHAPASMPIVIAQHMPDFFAASLAQVLAHDTRQDVQEGSHRLALTPRSVTLIPGAGDGIIAPCQTGGFELRLVNGSGNLHPSVNALFESAALVASAPAGIVLTGMGDDGAKGTAALRRKGVPVLIQAPATCIVAGMPEAALAAAAGCEVLTIERMAGRIQKWSGHATGELSSDVARNTRS
ncbi:MAG: chemotaxis protein CheB [Methylovirgula sp.]|uniref:chemotaxis protein CheB n=1 Tax=Methylovirgula sp. TaxID=1978224 RepID=UPI0030765803